MVIENEFASPEALLTYSGVEKAPNRNILASQIFQRKVQILGALGYQPDYSNILSEDEGKASFIDQSQIDIVCEDLAKSAKAAAAKYKEGKYAVDFIDTHSRLVILGELKLLGPEDLARSRKLFVEKKVANAGIQVGQIEALLAIEAMHSTEVPSGQGKSNPIIPIAAVARHLLTDEMIHLMVRDPQAKKRDCDNLRKVADVLGLSVGVIDRGEEKVKESNKRLKYMIFVRNVIDFASGLNKEEKEDLKRRLENSIEELAEDTQYSSYRNVESSPIQSPDSPEETVIVVGTDHDFVFSSLDRKGKYLWGGKKASIICDEGDLPWTRNSPYLLEDQGIDMLGTYLPEWISMCAADHVCAEMRSEKKIQNDDRGQLAFINSAGDETTGEFEKRLREKLAQIQQSGELAELYKVALLNRIRDEFKRAQEVLNRKFLGSKKLSRPAEFLFHSKQLNNLVRKYSLDPSDFTRNNEDGEGDPDMESRRPDPLAFYDHAWLQAQRLVTGQNYGKGEEKIVLIDQETGHPLDTHQYSGLLDIAVEVKEGFCSLRPRTDNIRGETGFQPFLKKNYGKGHISLVSATLDHIRGEIEDLSGQRVVESGNWLGEILDFPDIDLYADFEKARDKLLEMLCENAKSGRPFLLICDNDLELESLQKIISDWNTDEGYTINVVDSRSSLDHEIEVFASAGHLLQITLSNPRGGRMIDIKTDETVDNTGGLRLLVWGPLKSETTLRQIVARTKRAGHPGEVSWFVYKKDGRLALADLPQLLRDSQLRTALDSLTDAARIKYDQSLINKIHNLNLGDSEQERVFLELHDEYKNYVFSKLLSLLGKKTGMFEGHALLSDSYLRDYVNLKWGRAIQQLAEHYLHLATLYSVSSVGDMYQIGGRVMNESRQVKLFSGLEERVVQDAVKLGKQLKLIAQTVRASKTFIREENNPKRDYLLTDDTFPLDDGSIRVFPNGAVLIIPRAHKGKRRAIYASFPKDPSSFYLCERKDLKGITDQKSKKSRVGFTIYDLAADNSIDGTRAISIAIGEDGKTTNRQKRRNMRRLLKWKRFISDVISEAQQDAGMKFMEELIKRKLYNYDAVI